MQNTLHINNIGNTFTRPMGWDLIKKQSTFILDSLVVSWKSPININTSFTSNYHR